MITYYDDRSVQVTSTAVRVDGRSYPLAELTGNDSLTGEVLAKYLPVTEVTIDNLYDEVVVGGFQSYDDVYRDIPDNQRPPKP